MNNIPWSRLLAESTAIVASILVAFAIDAWWDEIQDRESEQLALESLHRDFQSSREELEARLRYLEGARNAFRDFIKATPDDIERSSAATAASTSTLLGTSATFEPNLATLAAITADGRLALIRSASIRDLLSMWTKRVGDSQEDKARVLSSSTRVANAMEPYGGPFLSPRLENTGPPVSEIFVTATPTIVAELRRDTSFVGVARSHQLVVSYYVSELRNLQGLLDEIVSALEQDNIGEK